MSVCRLSSVLSWSLLLASVIACAENIASTSSTHIRQGLAIKLDGADSRGMTLLDDIAPSPGMLIIVQGNETESVTSPETGIFHIGEGNMEMSAPPMTNTTSWARYLPVGFVKETFDESTGLWTTPVTNLGITAFTHIQSDNACTRYTWLWNKQFRLSVTSKGNGTVKVGDGNAGATSEEWFDVGESTAISATAADNYGFCSWSGDIPFPSAYTDATEVTMTCAREISASFLQIGDEAVLRTAINTAAAGSTVNVAPGLYKLTAMAYPAKTDVTIRGNDADPSSVVFDGQGTRRCAKDSQQANTVYSGITFRNGYVNSDGGAGVYLSGDGSMVTNCVFENCHANTVRGGGLFMNTSQKVVDSIFRYCTSYAASSSGSIGGGGVNVQASAGFVSGCRFYDCKTLYSNCNNAGGAAIRVHLTGNEIKDCHFENCSSGYGIICGGPSRIEGCTFTNCPSYCLFAFPYSVSGCVSTTVVSRCQFYDLKARPFQARSSTQRIRLDNDVFVNIGVCAGQSPGFVSEDTSQGWNTILSMTNVVIRNMIGDEGHLGTFFGSNRCNDYYNCTFENIHIYPAQNSMFILKKDGRMEGCRFINCVSCLTGGVGGGIVKCDGSNCVVRSCYFTGCRGGQIGGVCVAVSDVKKPETYSVTIDNCTFATNRPAGTVASYYGGVLKLTTSCRVRNCLFYKNTSAVSAYTVYQGYNGNRLSCFENCWEADGNTQLANNESCIVDSTDAIDLKFSNSDPLANNDFSINGTSPLKNAGVDLDYLTDARNLPRSKQPHDITGHCPRLSGSHPDIGAWEFYQNPVFIMSVR